MTKTYQPSSKEIKRDWHLVDAKDQVLGRLATQVAILLMGKQKANYSAHMDSGDFVVVTNCEKIVVTGKKSKQKVYRSHSGYPKGFKEVSYEKMLEERPQDILIHAIKGMLPDNKLKADRLARLTVVKGERNPMASKFPKVAAVEETK